MNNYYFLMASLPSLDGITSANIPLSKEDFLDAARSSLSDNVYAVVDDILNDRETKCRFLSSYNALKAEMDKVVRALRAERLGIYKDEYKLTRAVDAYIFDKLKAIVYNPSPLKAEMEIIDLYANTLSSLQVFSRFNKRDLIFYTIKLKLLLQSKRFDKEGGKEEFGRIFDLLKFRAEEVV